MRWASRISGRSTIKPSTSATMAISPASQGRRAQRIGATSRCMSGAAPTTWRRPAAKACKDTVARVAAILHRRRSCRACCAARHVLVSAHGNSLRALIMVLERCRPREIVERELGHRGADRSTGSMPMRPWRRSWTWRPERSIPSRHAAGLTRGSMSTRRWRGAVRIGLPGQSWQGRERALDRGIAESTPPQPAFPPPSRAWRACG